MILNAMEKRLLFQVEGDCLAKVLNELHMVARYTKSPEQGDAAESLMAKLRPLTDAEGMDMVRDIQKNYRLPYPARTIGEKIAEARQQSGAEKLKGHDIMALERFDPEVKHMIVFDVLSGDAPVGDKGDKMRLFLTDAGYEKFLDSQDRGEVKLKNHAVLKGKGASFAHAVPAGGLGLYHQGACPYLQGRRGFHHYRPERAGTARVPHQTAPPL